VDLAVLEALAAAAAWCITAMIATDLLCWLRTNAAASRPPTAPAW